MNQVTYYTIRVCKRGEAPLSRRSGDRYEYNYDEQREGTARSQLASMRSRFPEYDHHLLQTIVTVVDAQPEVTP